MAIHRVIMCDTLHLSLVGWHFPVPSSALYYGSAYLLIFLGITCESAKVAVRAWQMPSGESV